jgi:tetratricopeptide (TPR) repeat protein
MSSLQAAGPCTPEIAKVVSIQGLVELRRFAAAGSQETGWQAAELNVVLCAGDAVRTHERARAALLLSNETTLRLDQLTALTLAAPEADKASLMDLLAGALHVITRTSRPFKVRTPFVNANVEGTEFLVAVGEQSASVSVYEGRLTADNDRGSVAVASGERAIAAKDSAPRKEVVVRPRDAVQWALYFPAIFDYSVGAAVARAPGESALQESIELYRKGRLAEAIASLQNVPERLSNPQLFVYRAGLFLLVGRLDEAKPDIERAIALDPRNSDAYSLQAVIAVVQNDKDEALQLADKAVALDPASPAARISLSYAQQARFQIEQSLATVQKAVDLDPQNALAWARLAELEMSTGNLDRALGAAKRATGLNPELAKTQSVLGFANLTRIDISTAKQAFQKAIELDSADPLPRLGLGLARIREGDLKEGREQIEIATSLHPNQSLIRSYLGKAYYEEKRDKLAATQFGQAKERDPSDPTPWLYDAIRKQTENRPVEALQDLERSIELNDNRAVYRSRLLLDEDQAARRVNQARIYRDLGFEQLALIEAYKSLAVDPGSDSAHRFLADAYSDVERGDITRVSESLQAQLRQPTAIPAIDLLLGTDNLFILRDTGPFRLGASEFNQLFDRDQVRAQIDAIGGTHKTLGDQLIVSGLADKVGYAVSQLHYGTNGFRDNNDARKDIYDVFVQGQVSPDSTAQLDLKRSRLAAGETFLAFDPSSISPEKIKENSDSVRLGGHSNVNSKSDVIWSAIYEYRQRFLDTLAPVPFTVRDAARTYTGELQHVLRFGVGHLVAGIGYLNSDDDYPDYGSDVKSKSANAYVYGHWNAANYDFSAELGLAAEYVNTYYSNSDSQVKRRRLSPKVGLTWAPVAGTTLRAAAFSSVKRPFIGSQTIEPTQVAGFNQFFSGFSQFFGDDEGTVSRRACFAVDQKFSPMTFAGAELTARRLKVPSPDTDYDWREKTAHLYGYKAYGPLSNSLILSGWQIATSLEYQFEKIDHSELFPGPEGILNVSTERVPVTARFFNAGGLTVGAATSYVRQWGIFNNGPGANFPKRDSAWVTDLFVDYRLPQRRGILSIGAKNLFDRSIDLFETDPALPQVPAGRFVYARARFSFF